MKKIPIIYKPKNSANTNLFNILDDNIIKLIYKKLGSQKSCDWCGSDIDQLKIHDVYSFDLENETQKLESVDAVCSKCNDSIKNISDPIEHSKAMDYICNVNKISSHEYTLMLDEKYHVEHLYDSINWDINLDKLRMLITNIPITKKLKFTFEQRIVAAEKKRTAKTLKSNKSKTRRSTRRKSSSRRRRRS